MKTFDRKDMFTIANLEDARKYINCEGYFLDSFYKDLHKWRKGILKEVNEYSTDYPFIELNTKGGLSIGFRFFLPVDKVRKEKKWRAFKTIEEFFDIYNKNVDSIITYRLKDNPLREITTNIMGYIKEANREDQLQLGAETLQLSTWHEVIEIWNEDKESWLPFGVEE
ncbi:hypothetical protein [Succinivibrio sp.]|uniref:hypothetical protein n=1 Tax=Succinivibrio sp. TaxID=2053619 RepID=UPI00386D8E9C